MSKKRKEEHELSKEQWQGMAMENERHRRIAQKRHDKIFIEHFKMLKAMWRTISNPTITRDNLELLLTAYDDALAGFNTSGNKCNVCHFSMRLSDTILLPDCNHVFHPDCIEKSIKCPTCGTLIGDYSRSNIDKLIRDDKIMLANDTEESDTVRKMKMLDREEYMKEAKEQMEVAKTSTATTTNIEKEVKPTTPTITTVQGLPKRSLPPLTDLPAASISTPIIQKRVEVIPQQEQRLIPAKPFVSTRKAFVISTKFLMID
jgi:hypothetical protein